MGACVKRLSTVYVVYVVLEREGQRDEVIVLRKTEHLGLLRDEWDDFGPEIDDLCTGVGGAVKVSALAMKTVMVGQTVFFPQEAVSRDFISGDVTRIGREGKEGFEIWPWVKVGKELSDM